MERTTDKNISKLSVADALLSLKTKTSGISSDEATIRQEKFGPNIFRKSHDVFLKVFFRQFNNAIVYLLIVSGVTAFAAGYMVDGGVIGVILVANTLLGFIQEYRSERATEKLSGLVKNHVLVMRDNRETMIPQDQLVSGDIIILKDGDIVPADCRVIACEDFMVNESRLTGESVAILKKTVSSGDNNQAIVYAGSILEEGEATLVVFAIGSETKLGKLVDLSISTHRTTQYEKSLRSFSTLLIKLCIIFIPLIFIIKILIIHDYLNLTENFIFMFAFAIAIVPEALPAVITVVLSSGAIKLAKQSVVVKKLSSIEDIGNVTVLCTDKTGTLTENMLTIDSIVSDQPEWLQVLAYACMDFVDSKRKKLTSSYDIAFDKYVSHDLELRSRQLHKIKELPFHTESRRRRIILEDTSNRKRYLVEIGSAETLLSMSYHPNKSDYLKQIISGGTKGIRHLGIAVKEIDVYNDYDVINHEDGLDFLGFVRLTDSLKPTAKETIRLARRLGVEVKILTGDSIEVAIYIAEKVGLIKPGDKVYSGKDIDELTDIEMIEAVKSRVFAMVTPEQKYRIIEILKRSEVVAYQGDGVNDAPSLKLADVGIAVNTATDVAKDSADIFLLNPDLGIIIQAISSGRATFVNINKYIRYTMIGNFSSFFTLAILYISGGAVLPLLPVQLLIVSSFTQLPMVAIASDNVENDELKQPCRYNVRSLIFISLFLGIITTICQLLFYVLISNQKADIVQTSLFLFLVLVQIIVIFSMRNYDFFWKTKAPSKQLLASVGLTCLVTIAILYVEPFRGWTGVVPLSFIIILSILSITIIYYLIIDLAKVVYCRISEKCTWLKL